MGSRISAVLLLVSIVASTRLAAQSRPPIALRHVTVIDPSAASARADMTVLISGDRITGVGNEGRLPIPAGAREIDARGKYLIPGLWDMHVHLSIAGPEALPLFVLNGVTGVRDMGSDIADIKAWRERSDHLTPRIRSAGPILETPAAIARYQQLMGPAWVGTRVGIGQPAEARPKVDSVARLGVDFLKIRTTASRDAFFAIARAAKANNLTLVGHAPGGVTLEEASDSGLRSIEHYLVPGTSLTPEQAPQTARRLKANGTVLVPTLISGWGSRVAPQGRIDSVIRGEFRDEPRGKYLPAILLEFWERERRLVRSEIFVLDWAEIHQRNVDLFKALHRAGAQLLTGTDAAGPMVLPGFSLHDELARLVEEVGLTPAEALRAATIAPARFLGVDADYGSIEPGKVADLVLLDADPLAQIRNSQQITAVIRGGVFIGGNELRRELNTIALATDSARRDLATRLAAAGPPPAPLGPRVTRAIDPGLLEQYAGRYQLGPGAVATLSAAPDKLVARIPTLPLIELMPLSDSSFWSPRINGTLTFTREGGRVTGFVISNSARSVTARRTEPLPR